MSRHVPRHDRWQKVGPIEYRSGTGLRVFFQRGAWWADVTYRVRATDEPLDVVTWESHAEQLGPFKRPRNAQVEAERHATFLQRRHGDHFAIGQRS